MLETFSYDSFGKLYKLLQVKRSYHGNSSMVQGCNPNLHKDKHHTGWKMLLLDKF